MIISPSLFAADPGHLADEVARVADAGAEYLHIDVMDGRFVPNLSFGPNIVEGLRKYSNICFDVHLMVEEPENHLDAFLQAGSDIVTVHLEATKKMDEIRRRCVEAKRGFGISLRPSTPVSAVLPYIEDLSLLLIMSINPGFGGQSFMEGSLERIREAVKIRDAAGGSYAVSVDGGINPKTAALCRDAGVDILVAGTYLFKSEDVSAAVNTLRGNDVNS